MEERLQLLEKTAELASSGHAALTAALPLIRDGSLYRAAEAQLQVYSRLLEQTGRLLAAAGQRPPLQNRSRLGSYFVLQVKALGAQADRQLTALLLQGIHDSVIDLTGMLHSLALPKELPECVLAGRLLAAEERCYRQWKRFL